MTGVMSLMCVSDDAKFKGSNPAEIHFLVPGCLLWFSLIQASRDSTVRSWVFILGLDLDLEV